MSDSSPPEVTKGMLGNISFSSIVSYSPEEVEKIKTDFATLMLKYRVAALSLVFDPWFAAANPEIFEKRQKSVLATVVELPLKDVTT
jgi:hypothetical protein